MTPSGLTWPSLRFFRAAATQHNTQSWLQTVKKGSLGQLHFKGDPIDRPPTSREWPWLMHRLVALSKWANTKLGLDKPPDDSEIAETQIKVILGTGYGRNTKGG